MSKRSGHKRSGHKRSGHKRIRHGRKRTAKKGTRGYRKGSKSKTMKGKKDFTTKKSSKVFNRRKHYQKHAKGSRVNRKPYHKKGGAGTTHISKPHHSTQPRITPAEAKKYGLTELKGPLKHMYGWSSLNLANLPAPQQVPVTKINPKTHKPEVERNWAGKIITRPSSSCGGKTWCSTNQQIQREGLAGNTLAQTQ